MNWATGSAAAAVITKSPTPEPDRRPEGRRADRLRRRLGLHEGRPDAHVRHRRGERRERDRDRRRAVVRGCQEAREDRDREQADELDRDLARQLPRDSDAHQSLHARSSRRPRFGPYDCSTDRATPALPSGGLTRGQKIRRRRAVRLARSVHAAATPPTPASTADARSPRSDAVVMLQVFAMAVMVIPSDTVISAIGAAGYPASLIGMLHLRRVRGERPARPPRPGSPPAPDPGRVVRGLARRSSPPTSSWTGPR